MKSGGNTPVNYPDSAELRSLLERISTPDPNREQIRAIAGLLMQRAAHHFLAITPDNLNMPTSTQQAEYTEYVNFLISEVTRFLMTDDKQAASGKKYIDGVIRRTEAMTAVMKCAIENNDFTTTLAILNGILSQPMICVLGKCDDSSINGYPRVIDFLSDNAKTVFFQAFRFHSQVSDTRAKAYEHAERDVIPYVGDYQTVLAMYLTMIEKDESGIATSTSQIKSGKLSEEDYDKFSKMLINSNQSLSSRKALLMGTYNNFGKLQTILTAHVAGATQPGYANIRQCTTEEVAKKTAMASGSAKMECILDLQIKLKDKSNTIEVLRNSNALAMQSLGTKIGSRETRIQVLRSVTSGMPDNTLSMHEIDTILLKEKNRVNTQQIMVLEVITGILHSARNTSELSKLLQNMALEIKTTNNTILTSTLDKYREAEKTSQEQTAKTNRALVYAKLENEKPQWEKTNSATRDLLFNEDMKPTTIKKSCIPDSSLAVDAGLNMFLITHADSLGDEKVTDCFSPTTPWKKAFGGSSIKFAALESAISDFFAASDNDDAHAALLKSLDNNKAPLYRKTGSPPDYRKISSDEYANIGEAIKWLSIVRDSTDIIAASGAIKINDRQIEMLLSLRSMAVDLLAAAKELVPSLEQPRLPRKLSREVTSQSPPSRLSRLSSSMMLRKKQSSEDKSSESPRTTLTSSANRETESPSDSKSPTTAAIKSSLPPRKPLPSAPVTIPGSLSSHRNARPTSPVSMSGSDSSPRLNTTPTLFSANRNLAASPPSQRINESDIDLLKKIATALEAMISIRTDRDATAANSNSTMERLHNALRNYNNSPERTDKIELLMGKGKSGEIYFGGPNKFYSIIGKEPNILQLIKTETLESHLATIKKMLPETPSLHK